MQIGRRLDEVAAAGNINRRARQKEDLLGVGIAL